jgi:glycine dehydrogenase subunit 1
VDISGQYPSLGNALLVCATETRSREDVALYARALSEIMQGAAAA